MNSIAKHGRARRTAADLRRRSARLSKYSNLCPYTFRVHFDGAVRTKSPPQVAIEYVPVRPGYSEFCIPDLGRFGSSMACAYDNKIEAFRPSYMDLSLSVTSLYDIRIHVAANCKSISFDPGSFNMTLHGSPDERPPPQAVRRRRIRRANDHVHRAPRTATACSPGARQFREAG